MSDEVTDLVLQIYNTVGNTRLWPSVLDRLVEMIGAQGSIVFEWKDYAEERSLTAPFHTSSYPSQALDTYLSRCERFEAQDQEILRRHTASHDAVELLDDTLLAPSLDALRRQPHVQHLLKLGVFRRAAGVMNKDNRWISLFSVQLSSGRGSLNGKEREVLSQLLPHLAKALDLSIPIRQLQNRYRAVLTGIDKLNIGICVLDSHGKIVARNHEFHRQQEAYRMLRVTPEGQIRIADDLGQKRLFSLLSGPSQHGKFGARPRKESILSHTQDPLCVEVSPLQSMDEIGTKRLDGFILCSTDTSLPFKCNTERIKDAFGLTRTELSLVDAISQGCTNPEIADRRGRSVATINAQTKSMMAKANCNNRTQFARMMMRFGASFLTSVDTPHQKQ